MLFKLNWTVLLQFRSLKFLYHRNSLQYLNSQISCVSNNCQTLQILVKCFHCLFITYLFFNVVNCIMIEVYLISTAHRLLISYHLCYSKLLDLIQWIFFIWLLELISSSFIHFDFNKWNLSKLMYIFSHINEENHWQKHL